MVKNTSCTYRCSLFTKSSYDSSSYTSCTAGNEGDLAFKLSCHGFQTVDDVLDSVLVTCCSQTRCKCLSTSSFGSRIVEKYSHRSRSSFRVGDGGRVLLGREPCWARRNHRDALQVSVSGPLCLVDHDFLFTLINTTVRSQQPFKNNSVGPSSNLSLLQNV